MQWFLLLGVILASWLFGSRLEFYMVYRRDLLDVIVAAILVIWGVTMLLT